MGTGISPVTSNFARENFTNIFSNSLDIKSKFLIKDWQTKIQQLNPDNYSELNDLTVDVFARKD